ncbi:MAG TPA: class I SAM-dependent methyltransferase [Micromonosporaceae bacterium]|nr:class I SAM-dependent methyltransferase [Micromonosporaceae bacterium]
MTGSAGPRSRDRDELDAVLYDWHNDHLLRRQRADEAFYAELLADRRTTLVLGAGTGRVAAPVAHRSSGVVLAVDRSRQRLRRATARAGVLATVADLRQLPFVDRFADAAVCPYSTFQLLATEDDRRAALAGAARALVDGGVLYLDVSTSFENRPAGRRTRVVLEAECPALSAVVTEVEEAERAGDHLRLVRSFYRAGQPLAEYAERWTFAAALRLEELLPAAGFHISRTVCGYRPGVAGHRRIYVAVRTAERSGHHRR